MDEHQTSDGFFYFYNERTCETTLPKPGRNAAYPTKRLCRAKGNWKNRLTTLRKGSSVLVYAFKAAKMTWRKTFNGPSSNGLFSKAMRKPKKYYSDRRQTFLSHHKPIWNRTSKTYIRYAKNIYSICQRKMEWLRTPLAWMACPDALQTQDTS